MRLNAISSTRGYVWVGLLLWSACSNPECVGPLCPDGGGESTGSISGLVTGNGEGIGAVAVDLSGAGSASTSSEDNGQFIFDNLTPGEYLVSISNVSGDCRDPGLFMRTAVVSVESNTSVTFAMTCGPVTWKEISAGSTTCAVRQETSHMYCWGRGQDGALGNGALSDARIPTPVFGLGTWTTVDVTFNRACGLLAGGAANCWGRNGGGALGNGSTTDSNIPVTVAGGLSFLTLLGCGVVATGDAFCWGGNDNGQLGTGNNVPSSTPVQVSGGLSFFGVDGGFRHSCGLTTGGDAYCWGDNTRGQLGVGSMGGGELAPRATVGGRSFVELAVGREFNCGLESNGDVWCWGRNAFGQLGDGGISDADTPVKVSTAISFVTIATGNSHACAATGGGDAYCWGRGTEGQLGDGNSTETSVPVPVSGGQSYIEITAGERHTCAVTTAGKAYCWGSNGDGEIGDGSTTTRSMPVAVSDPGGASSL